MDQDLKANRKLPVSAHVGAAVRRRRKELKLSLPQLVKRLKDREGEPRVAISPDQLGEWERGKYPIPLEAVWVLAEVLDTSAAMLLPIEAVDTDITQVLEVQRIADQVTELVKPVLRSQNLVAQLAVLAPSLQAAVGRIHAVRTVQVHETG